MQTAANHIKECQEFIVADQEWEKELTRRFKADARQARYEKRGRGSFDDDLGRLFLRREKARMRWELGLRGMDEHDARAGGAPSL